ncbi:unnamed protein product, partial [marine sediment metagenome]
MTRKTPREHRVSSHIRNGVPIRQYNRGVGTNQPKLSNPSFLNKLTRSNNENVFQKPKLEAILDEQTKYKMANNYSLHYI